MNAPARCVEQGTIKVMLVDDHKTMLWGLSRLIESAAPRMHLVATACALPEMLDKLDSAQPDVMLLDLDLGGTDSLTCMPQLQQRSTARVLVLTGSHDPNAHQSAILRGARGVLCKDEPAETILRAIECVHGGDVWLDRALMARVLGTLSAPATKPARDPIAEKIASLTPRERQIVAAIVRNCGAKSLAIASELHISEHTLRNHLTVVYEKLDVRNRLELFAFATEHGLGAALAA